MRTRARSLLSTSRSSLTASRNYPPIFHAALSPIFFASLSLARNLQPCNHYSTSSTFSCTFLPSRSKQNSYSSAGTGISSTKVDGSGYAITYVTVPSPEVGDKIASALLEAKLAACVSSMPVVSQFVWKGKLEKENELLLMIKTRKDNLEAVTRAVIENHTYEVPEVISVDIMQGNPAYLKWIEESTLPAKPE